MLTPAFAVHMTRRHHSSFDLYEDGARSRLMQSAAILGTFAYQTAMRPEALPRKALPQPLPPKKP